MCEEFPSLYHFEQHVQAVAVLERRDKVEDERMRRTGEDVFFVHRIALLLKGDDARLLQRLDRVDLSRLPMTNKPHATKRPCPQSFHNLEVLEPDRRARRRACWR